MAGLKGTGGLPQQRPDQLRNFIPPAQQPGGAAGTLRARIIIVSGGVVSGIFVYDGTPAFGNPPIVSITSGTKDPFGNTVVPGLDVTQGLISGTTFEGTDFIINSSGAFFYSGTPSSSDIVASVAPAAGTDPFGHAVPAGFCLFDSSGNQRLISMFSGNPNLELLNTSGAQLINISSLKGAQFFYLDTGSATQGALAASIASSAGTDIFGNSYPQGVKIFQGQFDGTDFIINSAGAFFYNGAPANGNLIASIASAPGTDGFSNPYEAGITSYTGIQIVQLLNGIVSVGLVGAPALAQLELYGGGSFQLGMQLRSGRAANTDTQANLALTNTTAGFAAAVVSLGAVSGPVTQRAFQVLGSQDVGVVYSWQPGSGMTAEETWNSLGSAGSGVTVTNARYRMLPTGFVAVDIDINVTTAQAGPLSFANTVGSAYLPSGGDNIRQPMSMNNASGALARAFVNQTTGQVQVVALSGNLEGQYDVHFQYAVI